jgi:flagellar biosynthesis protein FliP
MTAAGYAGMMGTLAFVLGLVLLVAKMAKRFLPGAVHATGNDAFTVVQRIALGQRQGIAIVQRGAVLIGVSVGDGGVRTLFTMPAGDDPLPGLDAQQGSEFERDLRTSDLTTLRFPQPAVVRVQLTPTAETPDRDAFSSFRSILRNAIRGHGVGIMMLAVGLGGSTLVAQARPTAAPAVSVPPTATPASATTRPAAASPTPASPSNIRTLPPGPPQAGPRDLPQRPATQIQAPRPSKPAGTDTPQPLVPAAQARGIAAAQSNAVTALPTVESQRIAARADSMLSRIAPQMDLKIGGTTQGEGLRLSGTVGVVIMMGLLSLLPMLLLMMTGFTRILVVLHFLKQALGTQSAPPGQLLAAMALLLSGFVMGPTLKEVNTTALEPWMDGKIEQVEMMSRAVKPFKAFMVRQVRDQDLQTFVDLAEIPQPESREAVPLPVLMSAFVTSELRTAFQIGFALFLPFIVIDVVVGSVLMSMGMVMLPPAMISMPFKLLLFVLVDGWGLVVTGLVQSFR